MRLHLNYEKAKPWAFKRIDIKDIETRRAGIAPRVLLKAYKEEGLIRLNGETQLLGIPSEAWEFKLGIRSALEWILDQYSESTPRDQIIREKFDNYAFLDHKENVVDLLGKVVRISVETQKIIAEMKKTTQR